MEKSSEPKREILIGLVGHPSSGKDTVANHLVDLYGFHHISTGDLVRDYITKNSLGETNRDNLRLFSTKLREENGANYLVRLALQDESPRLVVSGLRAVAEATAIKDAGGIIVACEAPIRVRYYRALERGRVGDGISFEKFQEQEIAESFDPNPEAQNVSAVVRMSDAMLNNTGSLEDFLFLVDDFLKVRGIKQK